MFELYMIRHGLAEKRLEEETMDELRPLKKKGKEKMKEIAKGLKNQKINFDKVLTSPLIRSKESAEIINEYCGDDNQEVTITNLLSPGSSYNQLIKFLNQFKDFSKVAIVGHEPFLGGFASYCLSNSKSSFINLKKGGALMLEVDEVIKPGRCLLSWKKPSKNSGSHSSHYPKTARRFQLHMERNY